MDTLKVRSAGVACALSLLLLSIPGCHRHRKTISSPKSEDFADPLRSVIDSGNIQGMRWPRLADYQPLVKTFYDDRNYEVAWVDPNPQGGAQPSSQANVFIQAFADAARKGLLPEDYDAGMWDARVRKLNSGNSDDVATFDAAMTVSVMRYISDLHVGRVNPTHFNFDINTQGKKYDLPEFVSDHVVDTTDVPGLVHSVEPDNAMYRASEDAVAHYLALARQQAAQPSLAQPLPSVAKPLSVGASYQAADSLAIRLALEGDLPQSEAPVLPEQARNSVLSAPTSLPQGAKARFSAAIQQGKKHFASPERGQPQGSAPIPGAQPPQPPNFIYNKRLAEAVRRFQGRHGIAADGKLNATTIAALNVPLGLRVAQLNDSLERWRWLPDQYINAPLMVNLPEFVLRGYSSDAPSHTRDFTMKVVVGKVVGEHQTPVFTHLMKFLIFRPYWNVPMSIIKNELTAHLDKSGIGYLARKNFETVDSKGNPVSATAAQVERGGVVVREKPGPANSLGLIKFMFPNQYDIYLHSTPTPDLFNRSRRDFSHGCIRVQQPDQLAVWVLRNTPGDWDLDKVQEAMRTGPDSHTVSLKEPIPIVIFYATAIIGDDGKVEFLDDLYGYDKQLEQVLSRGRPYPSQHQRVTPNSPATHGQST